MSRKCAHVFANPLLTVKLAWQQEKLFGFFW